jgi:hypothetical protein
LKIQLPVNALCVFVAAQRLVAVHLPRKKMTKDKLYLLIMQKIKYSIVVEKTIRKKIKTKPLIFLASLF